MKRTRRPNNFWTEESILAHVKEKGYTSLNAWQKGCSSSYSTATRMKFTRQVAQVLGWAPKKQRGYWTFETLLADAKSSKATRPTEWEQASPSAYITALQKNMVTAIAAELNWTYLSKKERMVAEWSYEKILALVRENKIKTASEFATRFPGASSSAYKNGWMAKIAAEAGFTCNARTDADVVYLWLSDACFNGTPVYKFGVTSERLDTARLFEVAREGGFSCTPICIKRVGREKAFAVEQKLRQLGANPMYQGFNGATEFRAMSPEHVEQALKIILEA